MKANSKKVQAERVTVDGVHNIRISCAPEYVKEIEAHVLSSMKDANVPGFRPGHATPAAIKSMHAVTVKQQTASTLAQEATQEALKLLGIEAGARPTIADADKTSDQKKWIGTFTLDGRMTFSITTPVAPVISAISISDMVYVPPPADRDADVQDQLDRLVADLTQYHIVSGRPFRAGDVATLAIMATDNGVDVPDMSVPSINLGPQPGPLDAAFPDIRTSLVGVAVGDTLPLKEDDGLCISARLLQIGEPTTPELTDELAVNLGFESVADIRNKVEEEWARRHTITARADIHSQLRRQLVAKNPFDVPTAWVDEYRTGIMDLAGDAEVTEDVGQVASMFAASDYLLELLQAQHPETALSQADAEAYAQIEASVSGISVQQLMGALVRSRKLAAWRRDAQKLKTLDWLLSKAQRHNGETK